MLAVEGIIANSPLLQGQGEGGKPLPCTQVSLRRFACASPDREAGPPQERSLRMG